MQALGSYGRMLTDSEPPHGGAVERDDTLRAIVRTLSKMKRRNAIIVGPAGTGKSAVVYELARRMFHGDSSLPPARSPPSTPGSTGSSSARAC